jgi:DNA-binding NtrC family response regulator/pSer/pThr/pTyr-binding forkhead associated (FHA) protein
MLTLSIDTGGGSELRYDFSKAVVSIGASSNNDVVLRAPGVAPIHLVIRRTKDSLTFLGQPRQIVLLNGKRRARGVLKDGDRIRIGTATVIVRDADAEIEMIDASLGVGRTGSETEVLPGAEPAAESKARVEIVLYNEPDRLADGRRLLLEVFRSGLHTDLVSSLESFFEGVFAGRGALLAWLDQEGNLQSVVSNWTGNAPQLPTQTYAELEDGCRVAVLRGGGRDVLIYPVAAAGEDSKVYILAETGDDTFEEDRTLLAELAGMVAVHWKRVEGSSALLGQWEKETRARLEARLPGTSPAVRELRERVVAASRSSAPVLISGRSGSGRAYLASLIASLRPTGKLWIRILQARGGDDSALRGELFGSDTAVGARGLAARAGGGVVVVRDAHRLSAELQRDLAAAITTDLGSGFGSKVRWIVTTVEFADVHGEDGALNDVLDAHFQHHRIQIPSLDERREDLPLLIVRLLETVGDEQGKTIRGISLETLDSLLGYPFEGGMTELLAELRRLVSATPEGEMVRGSLHRSTASGASADGDEVVLDTATVLGDNNLKVVIPTVERLLIDRVLRRSLGNQSKAARELNLSRGALIAKIKEYGIPDYRSLRRGKQ